MLSFAAKHEGGQPFHLGPMKSFAMALTLKFTPKPSTRKPMRAAKMRTTRAAKNMEIIAGGRFSGGRCTDTAEQI
eukprot:39502-Pelagomonas_calceolata.AAC.1